MRPARAIQMSGRGSGTPGKRYWRIYITANNGDAGYVSIQEVEFRAIVGGQDLTSPTTPTSQSQYVVADGTSAAKTVDNSISGGAVDLWVANNSNVWPQWCSYDFGADTQVVEFVMWAQNNGVGPARAPKDFLLQYSGDTSVWTTAATFTGVTGWTAGGSKTFVVATDVANPSGALWTADGSSLAGWTVSGATVDASDGSPAASSFKAYPSNQYANISPLGASLVGKSIQFRAKVAVGGLANFYFGCDATGAGSYLRVEARAGFSSGVAAATSWTSRASAPADLSYQSDGRWNVWRIDVTSETTCDVWRNGVKVITGKTCTISGNYIGINGDGGASGGYFDSMSVFATP